MNSQDSPEPGRVSPISRSAPASVRGIIPLTARSAASGQIAEYVEDTNVDPFVNSESNRSTITAPSLAVDGQPSNLTTQDDGAVLPPVVSALHYKAPIERPY